VSQEYELQEEAEGVEVVLISEVLSNTQGSHVKSMEDYTIDLETSLQLIKT